jgi:hypothetical protein
LAGTSAVGQSEKRVGQEFQKKRGDVDKSVADVLNQQESLRLLGLQGGAIDIDALSGTMAPLIAAMKRNQDAYGQPVYTTGNNQQAGILPYGRPVRFAGPL